MTSKETDQYLANWQDELNNAALYQALAEAEKDSRLAEVYRRLATVEQRHAGTWTKQLQSAGVSVPAFQPTWRTRALILFAVGAILPVLSFMFLSGLTAVWVSVLISTVGLFGIGAAITLFTGRTVLSSGSRQVVFGLAAAALTYGVGRLVGVSLAG